MSSRFKLATLCCLAILLAVPALAGPPFTTDDPEPVDLGHWEIYGFTSGTHVRGDTGGTLAGVEINYGGGGFWSNPGAGNRDYWFAGWLLQYQVTKSLALGGEVFHQTADTLGGGDSTGFNLGGIYDISEHCHLLFSGGRGLQNAALANQFSYYLAIQSTF